METKNFLFLLASLSLVFLAGCRSTEHRQDQKPIIFSKPTQPVPPAGAGQTTPAVPPAVGEVLPVGVYFGPGAMRSYAHIGVLKALLQAQVPVVSVGGSEWGSVVAALYSFSKSANDVEWQMLKLRKDQIPSGGLINSEIEAKDNRALESFFRFIFTDKNLESGKVPFMCPTTDGAQSALLRTGKAWEQLMKCTAIPPFYKSFNGWVSGAITSGDWSEAMIKDGAKFIIYVDVLGDEPLFKKSKFSQQENARLFWTAVKNMSKEQYRQANMILNVPVPIDLLDFDNRRESIKLGEKFALGVMPDLLKIVGVK